MSRQISFGTGFFVGDATDVITSNSGIFASILREGAGRFLITMAPQSPLQPSDYIGYQKDFGLATSALSNLGVIQRVSATQFRVRQYTKAGKTDGRFGINISRIFRG